MTVLARTLLTAMTIAVPISTPAAAGLQPLEGGSTAAPAGSAKASCDSAQNRQFDFWLGQWEVTNPAGKLAGHSRIESILGGCVLLENWDSPGGVSGKSFNIFNATTGHWEQFWVDNSGSRLHLGGGMHEGSMVLQGAQDKADASTGVVQRERITWTPNTDGSVRQHWETSTDDGNTWKTSFDGLYRHPQGGWPDSGKSIRDPEWVVRDGVPLPTRGERVADRPGEGPPEPACGTTLCTR